MNKDIIQNEKQIVKGILTAFNKMESAKKGYVHAVIYLGEKLINAKKLVPHGQWEAWVKGSSELPFGDCQARKYMMVASNKILVLEYFDDEESVNNLTKAIADATPQQLERVKKIEAERLPEIEKKRIQAEQEAAKVEAQPVTQSEPKPEPKTSQSEPIDVEFTEVKPEKVAANEPKHEPIPEDDNQLDSEIDQLREAVKILSDRNDELEAEIKSLAKIFESHDQIEAANAQVKKYIAINISLESQVRQYQKERAELIKTATRLRKENDKLKAVSNAKAS